MLIPRFVVPFRLVFLDWLHDTLDQVARGYWMFLFVTWAWYGWARTGAVTVVAT